LFQAVVRRCPQGEGAARQQHGQTIQMRRRQQRQQREGRDAGPDDITPSQAQAAPALEEGRPQHPGKQAVDEGVVVQVLHQRAMLAHNRHSAFRRLEVQVKGKK